MRSYEKITFETENNKKVNLLAKRNLNGGFWEKWK
jgi:hypothetical protein